MTITLEKSLVRFCGIYRLTPQEAVVLPTLFDHAAKSANMPVERLASIAVTDPQIGEYLADVARGVA
jgi:hypothetical protein